MISTSDLMTHSATRITGDQILLTVTRHGIKYLPTSLSAGFTTAISSLYPVLGLESHLRNYLESGRSVGDAEEPHQSHVLKQALGNCRVEVKFELDEELRSDSGRDPDDVEFHERTRNPFAYRPFDETSWGNIDEGAVDIIVHCVDNELSGFGGSDLAGK